MVNGGYDSRGRSIVRFGSREWVAAWAILIVFGGLLWKAHQILEENSVDHAVIMEGLKSVEVAAGALEARVDENSERIATNTDCLQGLQVEVARIQPVGNTP